MMDLAPNQPLTAIACGGTGGHLFPGLAVGERLVRRGGRVLLIVSAKDVDQQGAQSAHGMEVLTLPGVGLSRGRGLAFVTGLVRAYRTARRRFESDRPQAVLAMGGFTSVAPILAARVACVPAFLHESNSIPGRANLWLSWVVVQAFVGFPSAAAALHCPKVIATGTPVRSRFQPLDPTHARLALGLMPDRPVLLIMGGSQGAAGINDLVLSALPILARHSPELQYLHLSGPAELQAVEAVYRRLGLPGFVHPFFQAMELALGAATVAISRAGASSLAELAAMGVPPVLVPYPHAVDEHQLHNAQALGRTGAACLLDQRGANSESLARAVIGLVNSASRREEMRRALVHWHSPRAADQIAQRILEAVSTTRPAAHSPPSQSPRPEVNSIGWPDQNASVAVPPPPQLKSRQSTLPGQGLDSATDPPDTRSSSRMRRAIA